MAVSSDTRTGTGLGCDGKRRRGQGIAQAITGAHWSGSAAEVGGYCRRPGGKRRRQSRRT